MKKLITEAIKARDNSYSPYSKFSVGAAVLLDDGKIIHGANIENVSYGLTNCAERNALFSAYSQGYKKDNIKAMAIVADTKDVINPCGACRQVMSELLNSNVPIYLANINEKVKEVKIDELLPNSFKEVELWVKRRLGL